MYELISCDVFFRLTYRYGVLRRRKLMRIEYTYVNVFKKNATLENSVMDKCVHISSIYHPYHIYSQQFPTPKQ